MRRILLSQMVNPLIVSVCKHRPRPSATQCGNVSLGKGSIHVLRKAVRKGWWVLAAAGLSLYIGLGRLLRDPGKKRLLRRIAMSIVAILALAGVAGVLAFSLRGSFEGGWGNGRGALWVLTLQGFRQGGFLQKLFGVGPDCFAEYIYRRYGTDGNTASSC